MPQVTVLYQLYQSRGVRHRAPAAPPINLVPPTDPPDALYPGDSLNPPTPPFLPYTDPKGHAHLCPFMFWGVSKSLNGSYSTETISRPPCVVGNQDMSLIAWYMLPGDGIPGSGIDVDAYSDETNTWDSTHDLAPLSGPSSVIPPDARQAPPDDDVISTVVADLPKTGVTLTADATYTTDPTQAFEHWLVFADHCEIGPDDVVTAAHGSTGAAIAAYHHPKKPPIHPPSKTEPILVIMQGEEGAVIVPRRSGGGPGPISKFATGIAAGLVAYIEGGAAKDARTRAAQQVKGLKEVITFAQEGVNAVEARK